MQPMEPQLAQMFEASSELWHTTKVNNKILISWKKGQNVMQHFLSILSLAKLENISRKPRDSHTGRHPKNLFAAVQTSMTGNPAWIYLYTQRITRLLHV